MEANSRPRWALSTNIALYFAAARSRPKRRARSVSAAERYPPGGGVPVRGRFVERLAAGHHTPPKSHQRSRTARNHGPPTFIRPSSLHRGRTPNLGLSGNALDSSHP
jgi:hypothetical protein